MAVTTNGDDGTDLKDWSTFKRQRAIEIMNKIGLYGVCFSAAGGLIANSVWFSKCSYVDFVWGGYGVHIFLMTVAFVLLGPFAAISFRLLRDNLGVSHKASKMIHGLLQAVSSLIGIIGVRDVYVAHEKSSLTYLEMGTYSTWHFHSSHSIIGIFALAVYIAQLVTAFYVFNFGSKSLRKSYHQLHMAVGQGLVLVMLFVAATGLMYFEQVSATEGWDNWGSAGYYRPFMTITQFFIVLLMISVILLFYAQVLL